MIQIIIDITMIFIYISIVILSIISIFVTFIYQNLLQMNITSLYPFPLLHISKINYLGKICPTLLIDQENHIK